MRYRNEWKCEITYADLLVLRARLSLLLSRDSHAGSGSYEVRSLYFDDIRDRALREKTDGVDRREKFRLRYYNRDPSFIRLEKKSKVSGKCGKESAPVSRELARALAAGDPAPLRESGRTLLLELYAKMMFRGLRPKTIVDYIREPYVYGPGNVRVTLDYRIRTGMRSTDFLNPDSVTIAAGEDPIILEVKWDEFLPDIIRDAVRLPGRRGTAFSKYAAARIYG
ncbi:MAG: polyphosphate polymerase domain-containing protein [Lachnospiraceae bacterium]|nr:polyphosphate polymerase domain-containing protein [Lachnospiraceae bacterium]